MHKDGQQSPTRKAPPPHSFIELHAPEQLREDQDHGEGRYRGSRDYPLGTYSYLEIAEVECNAHNAAYYDAAEALDLR